MTRKKENKTQYAILGILSLRPMSGYDIKKFIEGSIVHFWRSSYGQIYPTLKHLEAEKLVEKRVEENPGKPNRHVYSLSDAGKAALHHWLAKPIEFTVPRNELLLKLFFGRCLPEHLNREHLHRFRTHQEELLQTYSEIEQYLKSDRAQHPDLPYWLITLSYGQHKAKALAAWCEESLARLDGLS